LRAILNDGFSEAGRRALVIDQDVREFNVFGPVAFGAIGRLPLPLMARSIVLDMQRAPPTAMLERLDFKNPEMMGELEVVYTEVRRWAERVQPTLNLNPPMPNGFYGRVADRWRVLFSIADAVDRGDEARAAAEILSREHTDEDLRVILLGDVRRVFDALGVAQVNTETLSRLCGVLVRRVAHQCHHGFDPFQQLAASSGGYWIRNRTSIDVRFSSFAARNRWRPSSSNHRPSGRRNDTKTGGARFPSRNMRR
jgi:hypothetical protein